MERRYLLILFVINLSFTAVCAAQGHKVARRKKHHKVTAHTKTAYNQAYQAMADSIGPGVCPGQLLSFAQTLIGTPYRYGAQNPYYGFDCSGFVGFVFKSFDIDVPRSSGQYVNIGQTLPLAQAQPGDVILFTGTQKHSHKVGHMGIVISNDDDGLRFIHATSGKEHGVTITAMNERYQQRFVRIIRLLKQNDTGTTLALAPLAKSRIGN